jgi:hypothetical protein
MVKETVVADTGFTVMPDSEMMQSSMEDQSNQDSTVTETDRNVTFWNVSGFFDLRTSVGEKTLKMEAVASGDVTSQEKLASLLMDYQPPFTTAFSPRVKATITDTGHPDHQIQVETRYLVTDEEDQTEYDILLGESTRVVEE